MRDVERCERAECLERSLIAQLLAEATMDKRADDHRFQGLACFRRGVGIDGAEPDAKLPVSQGSLDEPTLKRLAEPLAPPLSEAAGLAHVERALGAAND